jgi:hypothetical protein
MPIFRFLAVTGSILVALLFVADATLTPRTPQFTNESYGLPRSEPMQPKEAPRLRAPALVQVEPPQSIIAAPAPALAVVPTPAPLPAPALLPAAAETTGAAPATALVAVAPATQARAEASKIETAKVEPARSQPATILPANTELARIKTAKAEAAGTGAAKPEATKPKATKPKATKPETNKTESTKTQTATTETPRAARALKTRKQAGRKHDRNGHFAANRDGQQTQDRRGPVETGYAFGVQPGEARAERRDWQPLWGGSDFGQTPRRF